LFGCSGTVDGYLTRNAPVCAFLVRVPKLPGAIRIATQNDLRTEVHVMSGRSDGARYYQPATILKNTYSEGTEYYGWMWQTDKGYLQVDVEMPYLESRAVDSGWTLFNVARNIPQFNGQTFDVSHWDDHAWAGGYYPSEQYGPHYETPYDPELNYQNIDSVDLHFTWRYRRGAVPPVGLLAESMGLRLGSLPGPALQSMVTDVCQDACAAIHPGAYGWMTDTVYRSDGRSSNIEFTLDAWVDGRVQFHGLTKSWRGLLQTPHSKTLLPSNASVNQDGQQALVVVHGVTQSDVLQVRVNP